MKVPSLRMRRSLAAVAVACLVQAGSSAFAQYSIAWSKIAGGGATPPSIGGSYSVRGTVGQSDSGGPLTNGVYSVVGGFWALPTVVQVAGAPTLTAAAGAPGQCVISWSPGTPGDVLQEAASLENPQWSNTAGGATSPVTVGALGLRKFYRLIKP